MKSERTLLLGSSIIELWQMPNSLNLGISGLTTNDLPIYNEIISKSKSNIKYKNVVLYIGSNDITHTQTTPQQIYENIREFILLLLLPKTKNQNIIFVAILKSPKRTETQKKRIDIVNRKMREVSQKHPNIHFCNVNRELSSQNNYLSDKTHLSETGYTILSHHISQII